MTEDSDKYWDTIIKPGATALSIGLRDLWKFRDLLFLLVRRDVVSFYKQTVLGPVWFFIQPVFTTVIYTFIFGKLAGLSTGGLPGPLFYLTGITFWSYFSSTLTKTSSVLRDNRHILSKVYFPRLLMPLSVVISNMIKLGIQFSLLVIVTAYFLYNGVDLDISMNLALLPILILLMVLQSLGFGMMISALTIRYRDLALGLGFGVQLLMYATPVVYLTNSLPSSLQKYMMLNPLNAIFEGFRYSLFGIGHFDRYSMLIALSYTFLILFAGLFIFNKVERSFVDTI